VGVLLCPGIDGDRGGESLTEFGRTRRPASRIFRKAFENQLVERTRNFEFGSFARRHGRVLHMCKNGGDGSVA